MKDQAKLDAFLATCAAPVRDVAYATREVVLATLGDVIEQVDVPSKLVAYGHGLKMADLICAIAPHKSHVNLMFAMGAKLAARHPQLEGTGKLARHLKLRTCADLEVLPVRALLEEAVALMRTA